jgi:hypothetical protein
MAGLFKSDPGAVKPSSKGGSAPQNTSVGSGSRPTQSKINIPTSAPMDPHTLGRDVPGSLK